MDITNIIGTVASLTLLMGYLPQTIQTIRTRSTDDIAMGTFLLITIGSICFTAQGVLTDNIPLAVTNGLVSIMSGIIFGIKIHNDFGGGKGKRKK